MEIRKITYTAIFFCCFCFFIRAQQPYSINYTTENGLPSNEIYCSYQDTSGYMWFGTENGVSRYDGYTFENFGIADGLDKLEINLIIPDKDGKVWFSSYFGKVYYREGNQFCPYKWNDILERYKKMTNLVNLHHIDEEGTFYFRLNSLGILLVYEDGKEELITADCGVCNLILKTKKGQLINETIGDKNHKLYLSELKTSLTYGENKIYYKDKQQKKALIWKVMNEGETSNLSQIIAWNDSISLFCIYKNTYIIDNESISPILVSPSSINIYYKDEEDLYIGHQNNEGLYIYRHLVSKQKIEPEKWLKGSEVSGISRDRNQGLWVTTINDGLYYFPNDKVKVFQNIDEGKSNKITAIEPTGIGNVKAISFDGDLFWLKKYRFDHQMQIRNKSNLHDITQNDEFTFIRGMKIDKEFNTSFYKNNYPNRFERKWIFESFYGSDRFYLFEYNIKTKVFDLILNEDQNSDFIWDMFRDQKNTFWLATNGGLKTFSDNILNNVVPELRNIKTISIDQLKTGQIVVGTKGKGLYILDDNYKILTNITSSDGLSTDLIEYLWIDDEDNIWVATLKGLNKIIISKDNSINVRQYHTQHGLPTEEILMVRSYGKDVWLATGKGVVLFREDSIKNSTFKPSIIRILVNGKDNFRTNLNHAENNIRIDLKNYDFACARKVRYRYRLEKGSDWTIQSGNILNFINMAPDSYRLAVQAENKDGLWSESLIIPFIINKPWWLSWFFLFSMASGIGLLLYMYYRSRIKAIRSVQDLKNQMLDYEKKALLAQMNPHFIFNAFSAIQYYINTNDVKKADDYLTDFSYLIRRILDNSSKKDILLSEEVNLLKLYTSLEERRFDQKFTTIIHIDEEIYADVTRLPCMLVQPLVENAINHGLMHLTERKGKLLISFIDNDGDLLIIVEDNGVGMLKSKDRSLHESQESYGLKLINDRITSYKNSGEYNITLTQSDLFENDSAIGTRFSLAIQQSLR